MKKYKSFFLLIIAIFVTSLVFAQTNQTKASKATYQQRTLPKKFKDKYQGSRFNYAENQPKKRKQEVTENPEPVKVKAKSIKLPENLLTIVSVVLISLLLMAILYYIYNNSNFSFQKKNHGKLQASVEEVQENLETLAQTDLQQLIEQAKNKQEFRKATRYYYLWLLQKLNQKKIIDWDKDKTDFVYVNELKNHAIQSSFMDLLHVYDYVWYGKYSLNQIEFDQAEGLFLKTLQKV